MSQHISWVEISRSAIKNNSKQFTRLLGPDTNVMAVVKANAYGHAMQAVANIVTKSGIRWLGVASLHEALELRSHGIRCRIIVLSFYDPRLLREAIKKNITLTVYSYRAAQKIQRIAQGMRRKATVHLKIDTGTSRLGVLPSEAPKTAMQIDGLSWVRLEGIFSHFADAENPNQKVSKQQLKTFNTTVTEIEAKNISIPIKHIACSAATLLQSDSHLSLARIGISLYGLWSVEKNGSTVQKLHRTFKLKPALSWRTKVIQIKTVPAGGAIGYGQTHRVKKDTPIAVLATGYWDGYSRALSNKGSVLINGKRCPVVGRVCMNIMMVDLRRCPGVKPGDTATLIGTDKNQTITADELAQYCDTINYEIVTTINPLIPRVVTK